MSPDTHLITVDARDLCITPETLDDQTGISPHSLCHRVHGKLAFLAEGSNSTFKASPADPGTGLPNMERRKSDQADNNHGKPTYPGDTVGRKRTVCEESEADLDELQATPSDQNVRPITTEQFCNREIRG